MATIKEQMMLKAISDYTKTHTSFRNRHIAHLTDLARQDVNHYLKKWEGRGFVGKNPLAAGEWVVIDMPGLIADMIEPTDNTRISHCDHELFEDDRLARLHEYTDSIAALRALRDPSLVEAKDMVEKYINAAINELRNERTYMNRKSYSTGKARLVVQKNRGLLERMGVDVDSILEKTDIKTLTLVDDYVESEPVDVEDLPEVREARQTIKLYVHSLNLPDHGYVKQARAVLEKHGLSE